MQTTQININGAAYAYARMGRGPTLVLLHYFGGSSQTWQPVMERLADTCDCLAPDARGWGQSTGPFATYTVDDMASDTLALLHALGITRYALAGHSLGGKTAQAIAARTPPGLTHLALLAPSPLSPEPMTDAERADLKNAWGNPELCRRLLQNITCKPLPETLTRGVLADNLRASHAAWNAWADTGSREDLSARYSSLHVPATIIAGQNDDPLSPDYLAQHVASRIAGATLAVVPDTKHLLPLEAPDAVAALLRAALPLPEDTKKEPASANPPLPRQD